MGVVWNAEMDAIWEEIEAFFPLFFFFDFFSRRPWSQVPFLTAADEKREEQSKIRNVARKVEALKRETQTFSPYILL